MLTFGTKIVAKAKCPNQPLRLRTVPKGDKAEKLHCPAPPPHEILELKHMK
ncbi:uncharacterized protein Nmag_3687 (plasmid) [Natrialba magadii ATCC 43099]|uniref:Uncharacterized protein n=1 Tax=Natrialba magadii (strain ATCC 43099 / DSM 3394 / CCM 3739 / CIP 104546 / IAM 13178 / JCM 8861 / NBRC 102185 / NCIMB 2190 / MS3) TaxID=547559 RepID=D3T0X2_NATMM|nr:uncharacterized protein Nmag_3687 [Natrialba magadii ATCC 43099]